MDFDRQARALVERSNSIAPPGVHDQLHVACQALRECCRLVGAADVGSELRLRLAAAGNRILLASGVIQMEALNVSTGADAARRGSARSGTLLRAAVARGLPRDAAVHPPGSAAAGMSPQQSALLAADFQLDAMCFMARHMHEGKHAAAMRLLLGADARQAAFQRWLRAILAAVQLNLWFGDNRGELSCLCLLFELQRIMLAAAAAACTAKKLWATASPPNTLRPPLPCCPGAAADTARCLAALTALLLVVTEDDAFQPLQETMHPSGDSNDNGSSARMWAMVLVLLLDSSLPMACSQVLAALATPAEESTAAGSSGAAAGGGGGGQGSGRGAACDAQWYAVCLLQIVGVTGSPLFSALMRQHLISSSGSLTALMQVAEQLLQQVPLGAGAYAIDRRARACLASNAVTLLTAVVEPLARMELVPADRPAAAVRHMAAAETLRLTPLILISLRQLLAEPEAVAGREECAGLIGNLALMLALIINHMRPTDCFSILEAAQLCQAAEAGVRFLPQLARLQARWQQDEAERLAASGHASTAGKLAVTLRALWDHAWEVAREILQHGSAGALVEPLFQLHSAGCRMAHACAAFSEVEGREQPPALPQLPGAAWASAYNSHVQVANVALLASNHAATLSEVEADRNAAIRWGYRAGTCRV